LRHSSRDRPLKLSMNALSVGWPGSLKFRNSSVTALAAKIMYPCSMSHS
jgi:hypothetical protein